MYAKRRKVERYNKSAWKLKHLESTKKLVVVPTIVGSLRKVNKRLEKYMEQIVAAIRLEYLQKIVLLRNDRILRKGLKKLGVLLTSTGSGRTSK